MPKSLNIIVLAFILTLQGCALVDAAGDSLDMTEKRTIIVEPHRIEINGDIDFRDWHHIEPLHNMVIKDNNGS